MFKFLFIVLLLAGQTLVPFVIVNAQQQWTSNLLNLFSDNFRNLLQQIPTAPLSTSLQNSLANNRLSNPSLLIPQIPSSLSPPLQSNYNSNFNSLPLSSTSPLLSPNYAYAANRYSRSKEEILQYSDEDPSNILQNTQPSLNQQQPNSYSAQAVFNPFNSYSNDYSTNQFTDNALTNSQSYNQNQNYLTNQLTPTKSQFDDDPLYNVISKTNLEKKNLDSSSVNSLNKNVVWDDYSNLGNLNLNAYNLENIYNNRYNYNRLPVLPEHVSFVPPPIPNLSQTSISNSQSNYVQPSKSKIVNDDLQQSPGTSNLQINKVLDTPTTSTQLNYQPESAFSSFLASNKLDISNFNENIFNKNNHNHNHNPNQNHNYNNYYNNLPSINHQTNQMISKNSVEQQYEKAKPFSSIIQNNNNNNNNNEIYQKPPERIINNNYNNNLELKNQQSAFNSILPDDALNKLYQSFASAAFNLNSLSTSASSNNNQINNDVSVKNPSVIYYDNFIHHQTSLTQNQQKLSSQSTSSQIIPVDSTGKNSQINSLQQPLIQSSLINSSNQMTNLTSLTNSIQTTNAMAPILDNSKLELTTQPQIVSPKVVTRKKSIKIKRNKNNQFKRVKNQRDFASRRKKKDELEAIEK